MTAVLPVCDQPEVLFEEILDAFKFAMENRPRNLQTWIGPSSLGEPCDRALIAELMELPEPEEPPNWRAEVGTAIHTWAETTMRETIMNNSSEGPRFLLERTVTVGTVGGRPVTGSCDCFDVLAGCVWDWKTKSKTQMQKHRRNGPGQRYRVQFHCYGLGMTNAGHKVNTVGAVFIPRDGEFSEIFHWAEPYDPAVAEQALARANQLHALASMLGAEQAMELYPKCDDEWCRRCRDPAALRARPGHGSPARKPGEARPATLSAALAASI